MAVLFLVAEGAEEVRKMLTTPEESVYTLSADLLRGLLPALMGAVLFMGNTPRMSLPVRAGAVPKTVSNPGHFAWGMLEYLRRCSMEEHEKGQDSTPKLSVKESLTSQLRQIQLLARMFLLCSAFEGFSLTRDDVQVLCTWLLHYIGAVQKTLKEVN